jgi:hypothetical protein
VTLNACLAAGGHFLFRTCTPNPCETTTTSTVATTTTTSSTTTTTLACCGPARIETTSDPGSLVVGTFAAFPFPLGFVTQVDAGAADATCKHSVTIPAGGYTVPVFCIPALQYSSQVVSRGCESGTADGQGSVWDATSPSPTPNVTHVGDSSDGTCNPAGQPCNVGVGGAGNNTLGDINTTRGGPPAVASGSVQTQYDIPVVSTTWSNQDFDGCPDPDGMFDGADTLVSQFSFILSLTTGTTSANFTDLNADSCSLPSGSAGPLTTRVCSNDASRPCAVNADCQVPPGGTCINGTLTGIPAPGPCCVVGQTTTVVGSGVAFSGGSPLFDLLFANRIPATITACGVPAADTCTLTTDACQD